MATTSSNNKYMTLENVRVSYDETTDTIFVTSKDPDIPSDARGFKLKVTNDNETGSILREMLGERGIIPNYERDISPEHVSPSDVPMSTQWDMVPLGKDTPETVIYWDVNEAHNMAISGIAGSGKSVLFKTALTHCLAHPDKWEVFVISPDLYDAYPEGLNVGTSREALYGALKHYMAELKRREEGGAYQKDVLIAINNVFSFFEVMTKQDQKYRPQMEVIAGFIKMLAVRGKSVGIHLLVTSQSFYSNPILTWHDLKQDFAAKAICGRTSKIHTNIFMGETMSIHMKPRKGRVYLHSPSGDWIFQAIATP